MTFDEAIEMLRGLVDRTVEVSINVPGDGDQSVGVAGFSGRVRQLNKSGGAGPPHWYMWFVEEGEPKPMPSYLVFRADTFQDASVEGSGRSLEEVVAEEEENMGTTWDVTVRQLGVIVSITVYV